MSTLERVLADYREMPGLRVTPTQAARLWHLAPEECEAVLAMLVARGELYRDDRGQYARRAGIVPDLCRIASRATDRRWILSVSRP